MQRVEKVDLHVLLGPVLCGFISVSSFNWRREELLHVQEVGALLSADIESVEDTCSREQRSFTFTCAPLAVYCVCINILSID